MDRRQRVAGRPYGAAAALLMLTAAALMFASIAVGSHQLSRSAGGFIANGLVGSLLASREAVHRR